MIRAAAHLITAWHRHSRAAPRDTLAADVQWPTRPVRITVAQEPAGPPGLIARFLAEKALRDANLRVFAALDLHGFAGAQCMLEPGSDTPLLIEIRRRMLPATHAGALVGIDLVAALRACVDGRSWS